MANDAQMPDPDAINESMRLNAALPSDPAADLCASGQQVRIKPLEWERAKTGRWVAGPYNIFNDGEGYDVNFRDVNLSFVGLNSCPNPLATAKADAGNHHRAYILAALTPAPQPEGDVRSEVERHLHDIINCGNCAGSRQSARLALRALKGNDQ